MHLWGRRWGAHREERCARELEDAGAVQTPSAPLHPAARVLTLCQEPCQDTSLCSACCPQPLSLLRERLKDIGSV